ncbi:MAG: glycerol-3-phosphate 1-O-acyltransferase PlsY [Chloroflexota bacterium]|nr:glycerol-3-phosphate 1-O-acyltransferase PlsY [Chloroflexota bacterium]MDE2885519.1 glycerol-3-phosphate 1-O-acyltransferase PlsY [Chloroflexota bacterium]
MAWLLVPAAYLLGSVQPGLLLVRLMLRRDVREVGSGKTGMTNVMRTAGKKAAALVFVLDVAKGVAPVLVAASVCGDTWVEAATAVAVVLGHVFPVFAGFRGGRGVATGVGAASALLPWAGALGIVLFIPVVALTRYVSLGSVLGVAAVFAGFVVAAVAYDLPAAHMVFALITGPLIIGMHRDNIVRLLRGTERRIGQRDEEG